MSVQTLRSSWVFYAGVSMRNDTITTVHVALDVHKDSIVAAYSIGLGEVQNLGNVGVLERDITSPQRWVRFQLPRRARIEELLTANTREPRREGTAAGRRGYAVPWAIIGTPRYLLRFDGR